MSSRALLTVPSETGQRVGQALRWSENSLIGGVMEGRRAECRSKIVQLMNRLDVASNRMAATVKDACGHLEVTVISPVELKALGP